MNTMTPSRSIPLHRPRVLTAWQPPGPRAQRGVTLIELMVGIALGLLVVAVATGALMASRGISGTVSDASDIQQQGAYAMRAIGSQLRQAASVYLNLDPSRADPVNGAISTEVNLPVAFEQKADGAGDMGFDIRKTEDLLAGTDVSITAGYRRYKDPVFTDTTPQALARNCLGGPANGSDDERVENIFRLNNNAELVCGGNDTAGSLQPIIQNVANFQVRYLIQGGTPGNSVMQPVDAAGVADWGQVQGIEVCLVLYGAEPIDLPAGSDYTDCDGATQVDMTTLSGTRRNRMHVVFRNVFQLRSQGLI